MCVCVSIHIHKHTHIRLAYGPYVSILETTPYQKDIVY